MNMEDFIDMAELNMPAMSEVNVDDLMADVAEVQMILQCNNIGQYVDVNEIYEKLEELTYISREQRIEYVATQLLHKLGVIVEQDDAPDDRAFRFSVQRTEDNLFENLRWPPERVTVSEVSGSGGTISENSLLYSNDIAVNSCENYITEPAHDFCRNFMSVPAPDAIFPNILLNPQSETEHSDFRREFDPDAEALINEAKLICSILPHHDFEHIYASLEAKRECDVRTDVVADLLLQIDAERGVAQLPCTDVTPADSVDTSRVVLVSTNPPSAYAPSVGDIAACHNQKASHDNKLHSNSGSPSPSQIISADADCKGGNSSGSEHRDKERGHETNRNIDVENAQKIVTGKLGIETQHEESKLTEENGGTQASFGQKVSEESVKATRLSARQKVNKENDGVMFAEEKIRRDGVEVMPLSTEQENNREGVEMTPLSLDNGDEVAQSSSAEQKMQEESSELRPSSSCKNIVESATSENGGKVFDWIFSDQEEDDTLSYNSCEYLNIISANSKENSRVYNTDVSSVYNTDCEIDGSHPSCSVPEIMGSKNLTRKSSLSSGSQDFTIVHCTDLASCDPSEEIGDIVTDSEIIHRGSDIRPTEKLENRSNCDDPTKVTKELEDSGPTSVDETEDCSNASFEQGSFSFESTDTDDLLAFQDSTDDEQADNRFVSKLRELFPDTSIDFLTGISLQFDSLTDMVNTVLECIEKGQQGDVGDAVMESSSSSSSVNVAVPEPPCRGCRKKEVTYEEFVSSLPHADPLFLMKTWDEIGNDYNAVKEFIAEQAQKASSKNQYHMLLSLFPHADPTFLREKCNAIGGDEAVLNDFIEEQSRNKTDSQYHTLLAMFPQADSTYLRKKCVEIGNDEEAMREFITEQLKKSEGDDHYHNLMAMFPDVDPAFLREKVRMMGDSEDAMRIFVTQQLDEMDGVKFETLLAVLPDADPEYLRYTFDKIGNDEESIKVFLLDSIENKGYPTREEFLKRQEIATLRRKYKEEFSIEDFIEVFPDPWKHFYEANNNGSSELIRNHGMAYLKKRYRMIQLNSVRMMFQKNNHNLTLTCEEMDQLISPLIRPSNTFTYTAPPTEDIPVPFLQEVAFIENKHRIKDFIDTKQQRKKEAFKLAKANGELLECLCCFDTEVMAEDMATCTDGHLFCKECIRRSAEVAVGNAQSGFSCLTNCNAEFSLKVLRMVLKPVLFSRMVQMKQLEEVQAAGIQDLESCPFCDFATIPPPDSKVFLCYNQNCMRDSCRKCKRPNHIPLRCDEVESKEVKMRTYIENRMTDALVRSCWKCKKSFIKDAGCNKMTCTCGAIMCYICRKPVTNYSHFNGQGGSEFHKCPLYSDLEVIHDVAVQEEGLKAKKIVQAENPDIELKHDPTEPTGKQQ